MTADPRAWRVTGTVPEDGEWLDDMAPFPVDEWPYKVLADRLAARIKSGEFGEHGQLPTARELMRHYKVGSGAVRHAWIELKARGLVYTRQGFGIFTT